MAGLSNETVKSYRIKGKVYDVIGCWDSETPEGQYDFYDLYDDQGNCLNEGDPYWELPSEEEVIEVLSMRGEL